MTAVSRKDEQSSLAFSMCWGEWTGSAFIWCFPRRCQAVRWNCSCISLCIFFGLCPVVKIGNEQITLSELSLLLTFVWQPINQSINQSTRTTMLERASHVSMLYIRDRKKGKILTLKAIRCPATRSLVLASFDEAEQKHDISKVHGTVELVRRSTPSPTSIWEANLNIRSSRLFSPGGSFRRYSFRA